MVRKLPWLVLIVSIAALGTLLAHNYAVQGDCFDTEVKICNDGIY